MAARVNTRFVTILSLVLIGLTAALGLTYALVRPSPESRVVQARALEEQGQHEEALLQYERALARDKNNFDYLIEYADSVERFRTTDRYDAEQALGKLFTALNNASALRPDDEKTWNRLAALRYDMAERVRSVASWTALYDVAQERLETHPDDLTALRYRGIAQAARMRQADLNTEQREQAREDLRKVLEAKPDDAQVALRLSLWHLDAAHEAEINARDRETADALRDEAVTLSSDFLADHPDDVVAQINHARILVGAERRDEAAAVLEMVEQQMLDAPSSAEDAQVAARLLILADQERVTLPGSEGVSTRGQERALGILEKAAEVWPDDMSIGLELGRAYQNGAHLDEAIATFKRLQAQNDPTTPLETYTTRAGRDAALLSYASLLLTRAGRITDEQERLAALDPAREAISRLPKRIADGPRGKALQGKLALIKGDHHESLRLLNEASNALGDRDIEVLLLAAAASQKINQLGEAARRLNQVLELNPDLYSQRVSLARLYLRTGQVDQAQREINVLRSTHPTDSVPWQLQAAVYLTQGQTDKAIKIFEGLEPDQNPAIAVRLAGLYAAGDRKADAMRVLRRLTEDDPTDMQALQMLLDTAEDPAEREAALQRAADAGLDEQVVRLFEARFGQGDETVDDLFEELLEDMEQEDPFRWHLAQYQMFKQKGEIEASRKHLAAAAKLQPDHAAIVEARFNDALAEGNMADARALADKARQLNLDQAEGQFFLGKLLLLSDDPDGAISAFRRGLALRPVYSEGWQMLGGALQSEGDSDGAAEAFLRALDQRPDNVTAMRGLARARAQQGDYSGAVDILRRAVSLRPNDLDLRQIYIAFVDSAGNPEQAINLRQQFAQEHPEFSENRRSLARLLARLDRGPEAIQAMDALIEEEGLTRINATTMAAIRSESGQTLEALELLTQYVNDLGEEVTWRDWTMLGLFLLKINAVQDAQQAFSRAIALEDPTEKQATRQLADALFQAGVDQPAAQLYEQVVASKPDDKRARLRLIEALLRSGDAKGAQTQLDAFTKSFGQSVTTQMLQGAILVPQAQTATAAGKTAEARTLRVKAIEAFDEAIEQDPRNAVAYYHRASVLRTDPNRETEAIGDLRQALGIDPDMNQARRLLAQIHAGRNEMVDAERELRTMLERAPEVAAAHNELAQLLFAQQRYPQLRRLLDEAAARFPKDPTWPQWKARLAAAEGRPEDQLALMRQALVTSPNPQLLAETAGTLLGLDQAEQALTVLNTHEQLLARQPVLHAMRARALGRLGRTEEAQAAGREAIGLASQILQLQAVTDHLAMGLGPEATMALLEEANSGDRAPAMDLVIARIELLLGRHAESISRLTRTRDALPEGSPMGPMAVRLLAAAQMSSGQPQAAVDSFKAILEATPNDVEALNNIAYLLAENLGRAAEALSYAERAAELAPRSSQVLDTLGWVQYKSGRPTQALETLRRSVARKPEAFSEMHLGIILAELGQTAVARDRLESARALAEESNNKQLLAAIEAQLASLGSPTR